MESARLGATSCTIDVQRPGIPDAELHRAEDLVNDLIAANVEVRALYPSAEELPTLKLRKQPKVTEGTIRIIDIADFDLTPCGGTHCLRTSQVGLVKVTGLERYKGNPRVQAHGPGFSKIILGDDEVDNWEKHLDLMVESIYINSGRGCINCSGIWASRHTKEIAQAIAERIGPIEPLPPQDPKAGLAAFTVPGQAKAVWGMIEADLKENGVTDMTAKFGPRLIEMERCDYLRPMIVHCSSHEAAIAKKEYMFPFSTVVECPEEQMLDRIGPTLVCTGITKNEKLIQKLSDAIHIDRLNIGPIPTTKLNWLQPHEGNIIDFLFRNRAYQVA